MSNNLTNTLITMISHATRFKGKGGGAQWGLVNLSKDRVLKGVLLLCVSLRPF
jgi:hypothetical protein